MFPAPQNKEQDHTSQSNQVEQAHAALTPYLQ